MIEIYTDGAYSPSLKQGGWAYLIIQNEERIYSDCDVVKDTTNNRMEIQAVIEGIKYLITHNIDSTNIYSDSMYVIGTMTRNWKRNKNTDLWEELDKLIKNLKITWLYVRGHNGNKFNEICDTLAVHASKFK